MLKIIPLPLLGMKYQCEDFKREKYMWMLLTLQVKPFNMRQCNAGIFSGN